MPTLRQLACSIEWANTGAPFKEYGTIYGDGLVETFIVVPEKPQPFSIHVVSKGFIFEGLAVIIFIDGEYHCNRNRTNLRPLKSTAAQNLTEVDFRLRQKEKPIADGTYIGREWRFDAHNVVPILPPNVEEGHFDQLGNIEVMVLRCRGRGSEEANRSSSSSASGADSHPLDDRSDFTEDVDEGVPATDAGDEEHSTNGLRDGTAGLSEMPGMWTDGANDPNDGFGMYGGPSGPPDGYWQWQPHQYRSGPPFEQGYGPWGSGPGSASPGGPRHVPNSGQGPHYGPPPSYPHPPPQQRDERRVHFEFAPGRGPAPPPGVQDNNNGMGGATQTSNQNQGQQNNQPQGTRASTYSSYSGMPNLEQGTQPTINPGLARNGLQQGYGGGNPNLRYNDSAYQTPASVYPTPPSYFSSGYQGYPHWTPHPSAPICPAWQPPSQPQFRPDVPVFIPPYHHDHPYYTKGNGYAPNQPEEPALPAWVQAGLAANELAGYNQNNWHDASQANNSGSRSGTGDASKNDTGGPAQDTGGDFSNANNGNGPDGWPGTGNTINTGDDNDSSKQSYSDKSEHDAGNGDGWPDDNVAANTGSAEWEKSGNDTAQQGGNWWGDGNPGSNAGGDSNSQQGRRPDMISGPPRAMYGPHGPYYTLKSSSATDVTTEAEEEPRYDVPRCIVEKTGSSRQVQPGSGYLYYHRRGIPDYIDTVEEPYARFVFKYRTKAQLKREIGLELDVEPSGDEEVQALQAMDKQQIIDMLLRAQSALGGKIPSPTPKLATEGDDEAPAMLQPVPIPAPNTSFLKYSLPAGRNFRHSAGTGGSGGAGSPSTPSQQPLPAASSGWDKAPAEPKDDTWGTKPSETPAKPNGWGQGPADGGAGTKTPAGWEGGGGVSSVASSPTAWDGGWTPAASAPGGGTTFIPKNPWDLPNLFLPLGALSIFIVLVAVHPLCDLFHALLLPPELSLSSDMTTPRCFILRHGETEWSLDGRHTGTSDIPLTANGEKRVIATGKALVGDDRLIVPKQLVHIYVSPRSRAQKTLELLHLGCHDPYPWQVSRDESEEKRTDAHVSVTEDIREWDYGDYEGITSAQIRKSRAEQGLGPWDIWTDGCPGGESPAQIVERLDRLIHEIRTKYHEPVIGKPKLDHDGHPNFGDVMVVGHGHILRAFAIRWIGKPLSETAFIMEAGGVGTLSYEHHSIHEPAVLLGGGFVVSS